MMRGTYNRWLRCDQELPAGCKTWIENSSGERYPVRNCGVGARLAAEWNSFVTGERDKYELRTR